MYGTMQLQFHTFWTSDFIHLNWTLQFWFRANHEHNSKRGGSSKLWTWGQSLRCSHWLISQWKRASEGAFPTNSTLLRTMATRIWQVDQPFSHQSLLPAPGIGRAAMSQRWSHPMAGHSKNQGDTCSACPGVHTWTLGCSNVAGGSKGQLSSRHAC